MIDLPFRSVRALQTGMESGDLTSVSLIQIYLDRIAEFNPRLCAVIETNPDALSHAASLDRERHAGSVRGPLHGIPVLLKDNIDTADRMQTTAGSLALEGSVATCDAFVAARLRAAGAVLLGKANLSEWANFRGNASVSGWSARGGQTRNPYVLDRSPCGSSSGSAAAVAAGLTALALGTETDGSILCPGASSGVVGIKPTVGLTSRAGVIPISHSQDSVGPFGRTVEDAALLLGAITGQDGRDPATATSAGYDRQDYTDALRPDGLRGARIGVPRTGYWGYSSKADTVAEEALRLMREQGAEIVDPATIPSALRMNKSQAEFEVLLYEFKHGLNAYLAGVGVEAPIRTLADLIAFNQRHAARELPYFGQEVLIQAQAKGPLTDRRYQRALAASRRMAREEGIDKVMADHALDALVMPTTGPAFKIDLVNGDSHGGSSSQPSAMAGYPAITVLSGWAGELPLGITFTGSAWSEPTLLRLAFAYEQAAQHWRPPTFRPTVDEALPPV